MNVQCPSSRTRTRERAGGQTNQPSAPLRPCERYAIIFCSAPRRGAIGRAFAGTLGHRYRNRYRDRYRRKKETNGSRTREIAVYRLVIGDVVWGDAMTILRKGRKSIPILIAIPIAIWMKPRPNPTERRTRLATGGCGGRMETRAREAGAFLNARGSARFL